MNAKFIISSWTIEHGKTKLLTIRKFRSLNSSCFFNGFSNNVEGIYVDMYVLSNKTTYNRNIWHRKQNVCKSFVNHAETKLLTIKIFNIQKRESTDFVKYKDLCLLPNF